MPNPTRTSKGGLLAGLVAAIFVAAAVGVWGYNRASDNGSDDGRHDQAKAWTVLQYQIADTDLEPFMMRDLEEMGQVGTNENLNIVALVDRSADHDEDGLLGLDNWETAKLLEIRDGEAEELQDLGEVNMGDPAVLSRFIAEGVRRYPAENYALIMSDHGASWPGVGGDESAEHDSLTLAELRGGVRSGLQAADLDQLDLLGFDACLMATYEVATNVAPLAERMVASEEVEPGHGWDYRTLEILADHPTTDADALGNAIVDGFGGQADDEGTRDAITLSVLDLTKMPALDAALGDFSTALQANVGEIAPVVGQKRARALGFGRLADPTVDTHMTDLGGLATDIAAAAPAVTAQAAALNRALDEVVQDSLDGPATEGASGLSIYFPPQPEYFDAAYNAVDNTAAWSQFLRSYYGTGAAIPAVRQPRFVDTDGIAEVTFEEDGVHLAGAFDPAAGLSLTEAIVTYGIVQGDDVIFIGEEPATLSTDGSGMVTGQYDLTALSISDGTDATNAYLDLEVDETAGIEMIEVPMAYYPDGDVDGSFQTVLLHVTVDQATQEIRDTTAYLVGEEGMIGELSPEEGSLLQPLLLIRSAGGPLAWEPSEDQAIAADGDLQIDFDPLPMHTPLLAQLVLTDYGGNEAAISASFIVP